MPKELGLFEPPPTTSHDLNSRIGSIHDHLYANAGVRTPPQIAREVGKLLHAGLYLEEVHKQRPAFDFTSGELRSLRRGERELAHKVASHVRTVFAEMDSAWRLYSGEDLARLSDTDIAFVAAELSGILISDRSRDVFGDAVEIFRTQWAKQHGGQFFTDQRVTRLAMWLLEYNPTEGDDLVDICAGTGGFLFAGLFHLLGTTAAGKTHERVKEALAAKIAAASLRGQEVDGEVAEVANASFIARIGNLNHPVVARGDSLLPDAFDPNRRGRITFDTHSCAASNPPFGTKITIKDVEILRRFELAGGSRAKSVSTDRLSPRAPDVLFLEQNLRILKPGTGRLAIVVPYQILSGPQALFIRQWIVRNALVRAIVDLPNETFQPHTGTKTALLCLQRRERPLEDLPASEDYPVFMSMPRWIGHDRRGNPVYRRREDGSATTEILSDFEQVERAFAAYRAGKEPDKEHERSFVVSTSEILRDPELHLNALFHQPRRVSIQSRSRSGWTMQRLGDSVSRIFYPGRFKREYVPQNAGTVPFLGGSNISQLLITTDKWLRPDDERLPELRIRQGWILITRSGSTGIVAMVPQAWDGMAMSEHVIRIVPKKNGLPPEWIFAFLRTRYAQEAIARGVFGSVIDEITPDFVGSLEVPVPTSTKVLDEIVKTIRRGEQARQEAIEALVQGVTRLDLLFGGST